jgi:hypothetical protein
MDLLKTPPDWSHSNWADRIDFCASVLFVHGYIPQSVRDKVGKKLTAQFAQAIEARRAETGEDTGSVHESAAAESHAPKDARHDH